MKKPLFSVVIPYYNEEFRIENTLLELEKYLDLTYPNNYEIITVDDASTDKTQEILQNLSKKVKQIRILRNSHNLGKGGAIKNGIRKSKGRFVVIMDADMPLELSNIKKFEKILNEGYDMVIGSKYMYGSKVTKGKQDFLRYFFSRGFNFYIRLLLNLKFRDTQCGFKTLTQDLAKKMTEQVKRNRFDFDVELLFKALKSGAKIKEVPIEWHSVERSTFSLRKNIWMMFASVIKLRIYG